ncbi:MAG: helix-turn-helix transcriptional regulator [Magnetococcales bacterium]|nr:helix-turn-helix transcriptional regulator [Magnetococcales bacterium]
MFSLKDYFNALSGKARAQFAQRAGIPLPTIQRHYIYKTRIPRLNRMRAMADAAGVPATEMAEFFLQPRTD